MMTQTGVSTWAGWKMGVGGWLVEVYQGTCGYEDLKQASVDVANQERDQCF